MFKYTALTLKNGVDRPFLHFQQTNYWRVRVRDEVVIRR
jgi:hypothetical protein